MIELIAMSSSRSATRPRTRSHLLVGAVVWVLAACAASSTQGSPRRDPNVISAAEIEEMQQAGARDLHEVVNRRRPAWLRLRTERSLQLQTTILVYVNETLLGSVDALRGYPLMSVASLRYLDAPQAMLLPGAGSYHVQGAIVIQTGARLVDTTAAGGR